ncbi:MAG: hypothetical protein OXL34_10290 [Gemmatimonadota bacterium]|nr:hypothetical protein [Gemmatimonadota bacterium]
MMQEPGAQRVPEADEVSEVLREILAGSEFATFQQDPVARLLEWVWEEVRQLWWWLRDYLGDAGPAAEIVTVLIVVVAGLVVVLLTRRYAPGLLRGENGGRSEAALETPVTAREWLNLASDRAGRGELRPAATALYQGFLLTLDGNGALSFHASKTPGDYALEMARGGGGAVAAGSRFLDSFQDYSFGQERPTAAGYDGLARLAREAGCATEGTAPEGEAGDGEAMGGGGGREGWAAREPVASAEAVAGKAAAGNAQGESETGSG